MIPDNVLFEGGKGSEIRRDLMDKCNLHTILRLPTGIFYAQGVKTNVLFFQKGTPDNPAQDKGCTKTVWVYDMRANMQTFGKRTPLTQAHFAPFIAAYGRDKNGQSPRSEGVWQQLGELPQEAVQAQSLETARWRSFSREWIRDNKGDSLDIGWLKDQNSVAAADLPEPLALANEAKDELEAALAELQDLIKALEGMA